MQELRYTYSPTSDVESAIRSQLEEADRGFCDAIGRGDVEGAARAIYTSDAVILPPGAAMVRGRDNIIQFWREAAKALSLEQVELSTVELCRVGDFVHQIGQATITAGGQRLEGKYTVLWKQEEGRWKWHVDCWNMNS